jgi:hypothetical protein
MFNLLVYGTIGLSLALAILTFRLLRAEQTVAVPRRSILTAIYIYMIFTLLLGMIGFTADVINKNKDLIYLQAQVSELLGAVQFYKDNISKLQSVINKFDKLKHALELLNKVKGDKINNWDSLDETDPSYLIMMREIRKDLKNINDTVNQEIMTSP